MKLLWSITAPITIGDFEAPLDADVVAELLPLLAGAALLELDELELDPQAETTTIVATAVAAANHRPRNITCLPTSD